MKTNQTDLVIFNIEIIFTVKTTTKLEIKLRNIAKVDYYFCIGLVIRSIG